MPPNIIMTASGKYILAGARGFLSVTPGAAGASPPPSGGDPLPPPSTGTTTLALSDFVSGTPASVYPVVQRKAGTTYADVPVLYSFTGVAPTYPQARVVNASGAVVKDWTTLQNISVVGSAGLGTLKSVPQGAGYLLQLRDGGQPTNSATISNGSQKWGVGVVVLVEGQSNMVSTFSAGYTDIVTGSTNEDSYFDGKKTAMFGTANGWTSPIAATGCNITNASGSVYKLLRIAAAALKAKYGYDVPVAIVPAAYSGRGIGTWTSSSSAEEYKMLFLGQPGASPFGGTHSFQSPKNEYAGDFEIIVFHQGENDATSTMTRTARRDQLVAYYQDRLNYVAPFGRDGTSLWLLPAVLGSYADTTPYIEVIRQGMLDFETYAAGQGWTAVKLGWNCIDIDTGLSPDKLHFSSDKIANPPFFRWSVMRMMQSILYALGCTTWSGIGPRVDPASITRAGDVVTVKVRHERAGATLGTRNTGAVTGWVANTKSDFTGTDVPASCAITAADTMQVTLALPAGVTYAAGVWIKLLGGQVGQASSYRPAIDNLPVDDSVYPSVGWLGTDQITNGLPIVPTDAIRVN